MSTTDLTAGWLIENDATLVAPDGWRCPIVDGFTIDGDHVEQDLVRYARLNGWRGDIT